MEIKHTNNGQYHLVLLEGRLDALVALDPGHRILVKQVILRGHDLHSPSHLILDGSVFFLPIEVSQDALTLLRFFLGRAAHFLLDFVVHPQFFLAEVAQ
mgnify:CR=1 FL=1